MACFDIHRGADGPRASPDRRSGGDILRSRRRRICPRAPDAVPDPASGCWTADGLPETFRADGIVFYEDFLVLHGRAGIYELSPVTSTGPLRLAAMEPGRTYASAEEIRLGPEAKPAEGINGEIRLRSPRYVIEPGFSWPSDRRLRFQILGAPTP